MGRLPTYALICAAATIAVNAQTPPKKATPKSSAPRAADGKLDLTGVYQANSTIRGSWEEANRGFGVGGTGTDPNAPVAPSSADRQVRDSAPYQPWAAKKVLESFNNRAIDDPDARCLPAGIPRLYSLGLFPLQIVQTPKQVIILYEFTNVFRVIPVNVKHPDDLEPSYMGDSVGHWEGDTLVVDVTGFNDKTWLLGAGTLHSEALHIVERYTRVDKDRINYEAVMEDPNVLTKPWSYRSTLMLREGTRIREYTCQEDNRDILQYEQYLKDGVKFNRQ
ncbi:MAG: hypothetical protein JO307_03185 [Bryobacterales bacterium]|nr:hypothetical protein [Bryobacterales bacterium]MBV9399320.1 hypothetical protein [Bryobacterales bacterium]